MEIDWDPETAEKQGYETFMLKEIHEQADAVAETIGEREPARTASIWAIWARSTTSGCGRSAGRDRRLRDSYHAGLIGRYAIEEWLGCPSRWRSPRVPLPQPRGQ